MNEKRNPKWWTQQHQSSWDRIKAAFQRDWDQTRHDFGGRQPDTDQDVDDTIKQAAGKQPIPPRGAPTLEEAEDAHRFGYGARSQYGKQFPAWNDQLESQLRRDWTETYQDREFNRFRGDIRRGWEYDEGRQAKKAA
jgi:hypothetical protein